MPETFDDELDAPILESMTDAECNAASRHREVREATAVPDTRKTSRFRRLRSRSEEVSVMATNCAGVLCAGCAAPRATCAARRAAT